MRRYYDICTFVNNFEKFLKMKKKKFKFGRQKV